MRYQLEYLSAFTRYIIDSIASIEDAEAYVRECYDIAVTFRADSNGVLGVDFDEDVMLRLHDKGEGS
jgi:hypothetical protein